DDTAISFASAFYGQLGFGNSVTQSFRMAKNLLALQRTDPRNPKLIVRPGTVRERPFVNLKPLEQADARVRETIKASRTGGLLTPDGPRICLWVHGWIKRLYDRRPTEEFDWTQYFDRALRRVPSQAVWQKLLFKDLETAKKRLGRNKNAALIAFCGKPPLTALLAIGSEFPEVGGYRLRAEQPTHGRTVLWRSDAQPAKCKLKVLIQKERRHPRKRGLLIALSVTGRSEK